MMTGEQVGVGHDPQRGAAYVENWVAVLEKDPHEIHRAARDAQKMTDYLMDRRTQRGWKKRRSWAYPSRPGKSSTRTRSLSMTLMDEAAG